jgi:hypothetical protein
MIALISWPDFGLGVASSVVATVLCAVALLAYKQRLRPLIETLRTAYQLFFILSTIRMKRFTRCRKDYNSFEREARTIASYIKMAKRTLTLVSIDLVTGVKFHGMCESVRELVEAPQPVEVHISLLDFREGALMRALAPALDMTTEELTRSIESAFASLFAFKAQLSQNGQIHLHIRAHCSIPFGSVIMIDEKEEFGRIQIETKAYKAALDDSWGFELRNGGSHKMFQTLVNCYRRLVNDGVELTRDAEHRIQSKE